MVPDLFDRPPAHVRHFILLAPPLGAVACEWKGVKALPAVPGR